MLCCAKYEYYNIEIVCLVLLNIDFKYRLLKKGEYVLYSVNIFFILGVNIFM